MLETAVAQLRFAGSLAFGWRFSLWSLETLVTSLRATRDEFGAIDAEGFTAVNGPVLDTETRQEMQLRRFRAQAGRAKETAYYARCFTELGCDPTRLTYADIARIPLTPKAAVREQPDAFVRRGSQPYLRATTTGTTGKPTSICFSEHELRSYFALGAMPLLLHGVIQADDIVQISTSGRGTLGNLCLAGACAHIGALVTMAGVLEPVETLERLTARHQLPGKKAQVSVLYTYASYLGELVEWGQRLGYRPADFGLTQVIVGGELVTVGLRTRAQALFGPVRFVEGYNMTELWPCGGLLCEQGHLHFDPAQGLIEIVNLDNAHPAAPGEAGAIVGTPFPPYRETTLLLRYNTEDIVQPLAEPPTCHLRHLPATSNLLGKQRFAVRHDLGWTFPRPVLEALEGLAAVPLPAHCGFWAVPCGVAVEVVVRQNSAAVRRCVGAALEAHGVPVRELHLVETPTALQRPLPLRCDLRESGFAQRTDGQIK
jgi:phenylacetate-coenzyme A ligase PaaK-like adenylate-forming protein